MQLHTFNRQAKRAMAAVQFNKKKLKRKALLRDIKN